MDADGKEDPPPPESVGLDEPEPIINSMCEIVASDETFALSLAAARQSALIATILIGDSQNRSFALPAVPSATMRHIVAYLLHHVDLPLVLPLPRPLHNPHLDELVSPFDWALLQRVEQESPRGLYDLLTAANYMDIPPLLDMVAARLACLLRDKVGHIGVL